jgi:WD40 repeat protein/serine/threonine protein kinase
VSVDFAKIQEIFLAAVERHRPEDWDSYLDQACGANDELRRQVNLLLKVHHEAGTVPGVERHETGAYQSLAEAPGTVIGPYKLLQQIGEGGMGTVWMAEQTQPVHRRVALKIIKAGMDSRQVIARFEAERQALAVMDHPNIARVFDAGTTETGRPFFVMELVKGDPITKYSDEHRLTPRQRLDLFLPVCQAIQHAHQKGIIHRDVKPSNVLVAPYDGKPVVKVIDFGVAKATGQRLTEKTLFTEFGAVIGTLEYMSPEQAELNNQDIDTRSDIYSLGVLLYELLTGTTPLDRTRLKKAAFTEMLRIIREEEPPKPSTRLSTTQELPSIAASRGLEPKKLSGLMRGELDWIVMKCLEKDRNRRYETANGLAHDIERYLHDEPVQAGPPSAWYRLRKFVRRNGRPVLAFALVLLALVGGIIGTTWGLIRAENARQQAVQSQLAEAEQKRLADQRAEEAKTNESRALEEKRRAELQRDRADQLVYTKQLVLAQREWQDNDFGHALDLLAACPTNLRGWEYRYLYTQFTSNQRTFLGHRSGVSSVSWSPDGKRLASASQDRTVKIWEADTGQNLLTLRGHTDEVLSVSWSRDGKRLASAGGDPGHSGEVKLWDADTGKETHSLRGYTNAVLCVCWSPDSKRLASACWDGTVRVWDADTAHEALSREAHARGANSVSWSPSGSKLASGGQDGNVKVWDAQTGQQLLTLRGHSGVVESVSWSPDGERLASAGSYGTLKVWDPEKGQGTLTIRAHTSGISDINSVCWSPEGKRLASGNGYAVTVWDASSGQEAVTLKGHINRVQSVTFSPDGKRLASAGGDRSTTLGKPGEIKLWDPEKSQEPLNLRGEGEIQSVCWNPKHNELAGASIDGTVMVWDPEKAQKILTFRGHSGEVLSVSWSPDGKRLASAGSDQTVKVWDPQTGHEILTLKGHNGMVQCVSWNPDGKRLAGAGDIRAPDTPGEVKVWDGETGQKILTLKGHLWRIWSVSWSPDGKRLASAGGDQTVKIWDADTGQNLLTLKGHSNEVLSVSWSPDGKRLASGGFDQTVKVWDANTGREAYTLKGHTDKVWAVTFSPDGKRLASASRDGSVKLWDTESSQEMLTLEQNRSVSSLCWSPDGKRLAGGDVGRVKVWVAGRSGNPTAPATR